MKLYYDDRRLFTEGMRKSLRYLSVIAIGQGIAIAFTNINLSPSFGLVSEVFNQVGGDHFIGGMFIVLGLFLAIAYLRGQLLVPALNALRAFYAFWSVITLYLWSSLNFPAVGVFSYAGLALWCVACIGSINQARRVTRAANVEAARLTALHDKKEL